MSALPILLLEPFGDGQKVVDLFSVNFLAFLAHIKMGAVPWPRRFENLLVIGNPRPSLDNEFLFSELKGAEVEAKTVNAVFGGKLLTGQKATIDAVLRSADTSDLIYVAAHGFSDANNPVDNSFIMLGDGRLTARQVQARKFFGRPVVVLSACQTGEGQAMEAGIVGLARAFQANNPQQSWGFEGEPPEAVIKDSGKGDGTS
jgi:hypothetical protein